MVSESINLTADQAMRSNVIEVIAGSTGELEKDLRTHTILKSSNSYVAGRTLKATFVTMTVFEKMVMKIADPNLAYIFMMFGIYGIIAEFSAPGISFPGIFGAICLILGLLGMSVLSVNTSGLLLILLAVILYIVEVKVQTHGMSALGGTVAFILGSIMLMRTITFGGATLSIITVITMTVLTLLFFGLIAAFAIRALRKKVVTGSSGMTGRTGIALEDLTPRGTVMISGEIWKARAVAGSEPIRKDDEIIVESMDGLVLKVKKINAGGVS